MPVLVPVHDLARLDLVFEHGATDPDAFHGRRVELDLLALAGDAHELLDGQRPAVQDDGHNVSFHSEPSAGGAGAYTNDRNDAFRRQDSRRAPPGFTVSEPGFRDYGRK